MRVCVFEIEKQIKNMFPGFVYLCICGADGAFESKLLFGNFTDHGCDPQRRRHNKD